MEQFQPVARRHTLAQQIATVLRERITTGAIPPGGRLPTEQQLADSFGVSRTVIREAVSSLKHAGLIDTRQGVGAFVTEAGCTTVSIDTSHLGREQTLLYTFEARFAIEPVVAALAAERRSREDLAEMRAALMQLRESNASGTGGAEADAEFHRTILNAARNPYFLGLLQVMQATMIDAMRISIANTARITNGPESVWREHERIFFAIKDQDPAKARKMARDHLRKSATRLSIDRGLVGGGGAGRRRQ